MSILEILDKSTEHKIRKSETGEAILQGVMAGIVTENYHQDYPGMVRVRIPVRNQEANILKWAKVVRPYDGKKWGYYFQPEIDDQVLVLFGHGNVEQPYILGAVQRDGDEVAAGAADEDNQLKTIVTRHGSSLIFQDHKEGDGKKDKIELHTAGTAFQLLLDNENQKIVLSDQERKCFLEMKTEDGSIVIQAEKKITFQAGSSVKLILNGESKSLQAEADKVQITAGRGLECKSDGTAKFSGQQTVIEASAAMKQSSSGMVTISGSPIKIG